MRNDSWVKLKIDLFDGVGDTLDLIIIGGYLGKSDWRTENNAGSVEQNQSDNITSYLVAIIDKENQRFDQTKFIPFCTVFSGMNREF